ncbi:hypothetical protein C8A03DRAFT_38115 [Achaetomium macrosporum]|uniref:F-box domain-containing protein n=1 Tax=Achaetomium macrosporum TaxID=79813 RepID=A0AAN7C2Q5_9PEZI|nr:hypothetical protein C8A03DRAFT_38115 [Achaetomium macrosporum]
MPSLFSKLRLFRRLRRHGHTTRDAVPDPSPGTVNIDTTDVGVDAGSGHSETLDRQPRGQHPSPPGPRSAPAALETLPAELRHQVLCSVSDIGIENLRALVRASPVFHQQYLLDRKVFLSRALKSSLGNLLVDAYAVHTSVFHEPGSAIEPDTLRVFMEEYIALHSASPGQLLANVITEAEDLIGMAAFYFSVICPLVEQCAAIFLRNPSPDLAAALCCNLLGEGPQGWRQHLDMPSQEILALIFAVFRPWEIEEIDCIYTLVQLKYDAVFDAIQSDVARENLQFEDWTSCRPDTPPGSWDLDDDFIRECVQQGTASRGLPLFLEVLETSNHEQLVTTMQGYMVRNATFIESLLDVTAQEFRRRDHPSEEDRAEARRERLPSLGDMEDSPLLAWVMLWRGMYRNEYGGSVDETLKAWGYVFWDVGRLGAI